jgi:hypothetical protein
MAADGVARTGQILSDGVARTDQIVPNGIARAWSKPEGRMFNGDNYTGIRYAQKPCYGTDVVAPDWFKAPNGDIYIVFSVGYYGELHGRPEKDRMEPYIVKVNELRVA